MAHPPRAKDLRPALRPAVAEKHPEAKTTKAWTVAKAVAKTTKARAVAKAAAKKNRGGKRTGKPGGGSGINGLKAAVKAVLCEIRSRGH